MKRYDLRTHNGGAIWVLLVPSGAGISEADMYNLVASNGMPIVHEQNSGMCNPNTKEIHLRPDPRCGDFEAELTTALDAHYKTPLAEQKYALIERAALQDIIDNLLDTDGERQFTAGDLAEDLMYLLPIDKNQNGDAE